MYILQNMLFTKGDVSELAITLSSHEPQENHQKTLFHPVPQGEVGARFLFSSHFGQGAKQAALTIAVVLIPQAPEHGMCFIFGD